MITRLPTPIPLRFALDALGYVVASTRDDGFYGLLRGICGCMRVAQIMALARRKLSSQNTEGSHAVGVGCRDLLGQSGGKSPDKSKCAKSHK